MIVVTPQNTEQKYIGQRRHFQVWRYRITGKQKTDFLFVLS